MVHVSFMSSIASAQMEARSDLPEVNVSLLQKSIEISDIVDTAD